MIMKLAGPVVEVDAAASFTVRPIETLPSAMCAPQDG
jgi:hypothetical protein